MVVGALVVVVGLVAVFVPVRVPVIKKMPRIRARATAPPIIHGV